MKRLFLLLFMLIFSQLLVFASSADKIRSGVVLYKIKDGASPQELKSLNAIKNSHILKEQIVSGLNLHIATLNTKGRELAISKLLRDTGAVKFAEPDMEINPTLVPNDTYYTSQWHHTKINSPQAWDTITTPYDINAVQVCVLDTGVDIDHPDLVDNLVLPGFNANGLSSVDDDHGHGTGTAGVIGAVGNNSFGVAGMLWDVKIVPVQINISSTNSSAYISTMATGIRWCADQNIKVANLSYGGAQYSTIDDAAQYLRDRGGLLFMSAGNDGTYNSSSAYPDWQSFVIVGSTNDTDTISSFSEYGPFVDITAPGERIATTYIDNQYVYYTGTSFSSPMTAGLGAMIFGLDSSFTPDQVESIIFNTAVDLGAVGDDDYYGHGRIDAGAAVSYALSYLGGTNEDPVAQASHTLLNQYVPLEVRFDGTASSDDGIIVSYAWNFGDGNNAEGSVVEHTYTQVGTYLATLTVTDDRGASNTSEAITIAAQADPTFINPPSALSGTVDTNVVSLSWSDNSNNETGFIIERAKKVRGKYNFAPLGDNIGANTQSFDDTVLETGNYKYRVKAYNSLSESTYSNEIIVTVDTVSNNEPTPGLEAPTLSSFLSGKTITLSWNDTCAGVSGCSYVVEKGDRKVKGNINFSVENGLTIQIINGSVQTSLTVLSSGTYYFRVKAVDTSETSDYSNTVSVRVR